MTVQITVFCFDHSTKMPDICISTGIFLLCIIESHIMLSFYTHHHDQKIMTNQLDQLNQDCIGLYE